MYLARRRLIRLIRARRRGEGGIGLEDEAAKSPVCLFKTHKHTREVDTLRRFFLGGIDLSRVDKSARP